MQQRDDRSCEPCVGHNERQKGERQEHGAHKSERLFSVINMEMAEEEKACNCEISAQRALPALLPALSFFFFFFLLLLSPLLHLSLSFSPSSTAGHAHRQQLNAC